MGLAGLLRALAGGRIQHEYVAPCRLPCFQATLIPRIFGKGGFPLRSSLSAWETTAICRWILFEPFPCRVTPFPGTNHQSSADLHFEKGSLRPAKTKMWVFITLYYQGLICLGPLLALKMGSVIGGVVAFNHHVIWLRRIWWHWSPWSPFPVSSAQWPAPWRTKGKDLFLANL